MAYSWFGTRLRSLSSAAALTLAAFATVPSAAHAASITLYNAQHEQVVNLLAKDFEKQSGISVKIRNGEGPAMAAQIVAEGAATPADVYFTENSPELMLLEEKGLLSKVDSATLATVPARFNSPSGAWVGVTARENVLAYNTTKLQPSQLPQSLFDLAKPEWKGKVGIAPSDGDFLPLVSAVLALKGEAQTVQWLKGLKANAQIFDDDEGVVAAVNRGGVATGLINNYYWARLHAELGDGENPQRDLSLRQRRRRRAGERVGRGGAEVRAQPGRRAEIPRVSRERPRAAIDGEQPRRCSNIRCTRASRRTRSSSRSPN